MSPVRTGENIQSVIVITDALAGSGSLYTAKMRKSGSAGPTLQKRQQAAS
jgi:hypothetical protein